MRKSDLLDLHTRDAVVIAPPLTVTESELDEILTLFEQVLRKVFS